MEVSTDLKINGKTVKRGSNFRLGHSHTLQSSDLIVWTETEATQPMLIELTPSAN
jgi:hypothetical protein